MKHVRFTWRMLRKDTGASVLAVFAFALGLGLTSTMFSIVRGMVLRGLPFEDAAALMHVESDDLERGQASLAVFRHDFLDWRDSQSSFESLAAFDESSFNLSGDESYPERFQGSYVTHDSFALLRVEPYLGRTLTAADEEPGAPPVVVLGYDLWRQRFQGDRELPGRTIRVNGTPTTVVGVMPPGFEFPVNDKLWMPLRLDVAGLERGAGETLEVFGRLRDGVSAGQARAELQTLAERIADEHPETNRGRGAVVKPYREEYVGHETARLYFAMLAAAGLVLLIACANVAGLLVARSLARSRELAIRSALGARRARVVAQLVCENLVLALFGAVVGLGLADAGSKLFVASRSSATVPFWVKIGIDPAVVGFVAAVTVLSGVLSGLLPAMQASRVDVLAALKGASADGCRRGRLSRNLVVTEIALACALLVTTGVLVRTVVNLHTVDPGFATEGIFTAEVRLPDTRYPQSADRIAFADRLVKEIGGLPEVRSAALMSDPPGTLMGFTFYGLEGEAYPTLADYPFTLMGVVSPEFFDLFGIPLLHGRLLQAGDRLGSPPVAVVNQSFAEKVWPGEDPLGKRIRFGRNDPAEPWRTVVGIVPDAGLGLIERADSQAGLYVPVAQLGLTRVSLAIRPRGSQDDVAALLRDRVRGLDADLPLYAVRTMDRVIWERTLDVKMIGSFFSAFALAALALAALGIYGVLAFSVSRRRREIGVRMALGAQPRDVTRQILAEGLRRLLAGVGLGLGLAFALTRAVRGLLFQVEPTDPWSFMGAALVLAAAALVACLVPAQRAARVEPLQALRYE